MKEGVYFFRHDDNFSEVYAYIEGEGGIRVFRDSNYCDMPKFTSYEYGYSYEMPWEFQHKKALAFLKSFIWMNSGYREDYIILDTDTFLEECKEHGEFLAYIDFDGNDNYDGEDRILFPR